MSSNTEDWNCFAVPLKPASLDHSQYFDPIRSSLENYTPKIRRFQLIQTPAQRDKRPYPPGHHRNNSNPLAISSCLRLCFQLKQIRAWTGIIPGDLKGCTSVQGCVPAQEKSGKGDGSRSQALISGPLWDLEQTGLLAGTLEKRYSHMASRNVKDTAFFESSLRTFIKNRSTKGPIPIKCVQDSNGSIISSDQELKQSECPLIWNCWINCEKLFNKQLTITQPLKWKN